MIDLTWKMFCQTGNIEAYLLLKELEIDEVSHQKENYEEQPSKASVDMHMY